MDRVAAAVARPDDDPEWARTVLFRDHDVLWLFEASFDGVEAPDSDESVYYGLAHLHPGEWFNRFDDCPEDSPVLPT